MLFKGGPGLIDLLIDASEVRMAITGPRMLFDHIDVLSTLSAFDGWTVARLRELAANLEGSVHCGLIGIAAASIGVEERRSGGVLRIDFGPASMYQSELLLRTRTGETFRALIERIMRLDRSRACFVGLHGVTATGHLEHHHAPGVAHNEHTDPHSAHETGPAHDMPVHAEHGRTR
jgi:hypothetical protein